MVDGSPGIPGQPADTPNSLQSGTGIARIPGTFQSLPQTVTSIPQEIIKQQNITTLDQALTNIPGVTVNIGEGGGGMNGDQFRIRGFQAKGDIYLDGLRDFGVYVRDSFNYERIDVFKGPSSESFGMGTTGGAINIISKTARRGDFNVLEGTLGTGHVGRVTIDSNKQINETTAVRINGMFNDQSFIGRDRLYSDRWGVAASVAFGLGTDQTLSLNYVHQYNDRLPDFGVPIITPAGQIGRPITEFGVRRSVFYGKETDADRSHVDMFTAKYRKEWDGWLTFSNDTRFAHYSRYFAQTVPNCPAPACVDGVVAGNFNVAYGFGGPAGFVQRSWGAQNLSTLVAKFSVGGFRHEVVTGLDVFFQEDRRTALANSAAKVPGTIGNPLFENQPGFSVFENPLGAAGRKHALATDVAVFVSDRVWLTETFSILAGVRYDNYESSYQPTLAGGALDRESVAITRFASPKLAAIWEPTKEQTYYVSWARSFTPQGQFVTNENAPINAAQPNLDPEINTLYEAGAKYNLLNGKLGITAALYRVEKSNAFFTDPTTGDPVATGEKHRVQGVELGVTGNITDAWVVRLAYAYMDSEILTATTAGVVGNRVPFVPEHALSLWTTYDIATHMPWVPGQLLVGGGMIYTTDYFVNNTNLAIIPQAVVFNALVSYEHKNYRLAFNVQNLTDKLYYAAAIGNRGLVAPGRTFTVTAAVKW